MIKALKKKYALSNQGAKDLLKGIVYSVLANISLMFPVILLAIVLNQLLAPVLGASAPEISAAVYTVIGIVILAVVFRRNLWRVIVFKGKPAGLPFYPDRRELVAQYAYLGLYCALHTY